MNAEYNLIFMLYCVRQGMGGILPTRQEKPEAPSGREAIFPLRFSYFKNNLFFDVFP